MFGFVKKIFKKKEEEEEVAPGLEEPYKKGDPIPYSLDFKDADEIVVSARDCTRDNVIGVEQVILRPNDINVIAKLLKKLSVDGERPLKTSPCMELTLTAYKEERPFAQVMMYDEHLKLENDLFLGSDNRLQDRQNELFELVKIEIL